jgi:hypothetical protein
MKKAPILITLVVILLIVGFAYFRLVLSSSSARPVYDAVPQSSTIIFEFKDFSKTKTKLQSALYAKDLQQTGFVNRIVSQLNDIDKYFSVNTYKPAAGNKIIATLHLTELNNYGFLYLIEAEKLDRNNYKAMMLSVKEKMETKERLFKEETIFDILTKDKKPFLSVTKINGILIVSAHASLVEEAVSQLKENNSILEDESFVKVKDLAGGDSDALVYFNFKNLVALESLFVDGSKSSIIKNLSLFSEWFESDIMLEQRAIIINGYTLFSNPQNSWISQFTYKPASQLTLPTIMSDRTALFMLISNADNEKYFDELKNHIKEADKLKYISYFKPWVDDEWAFGMNEPMNADWQKEVFLVVKNSDSLIAQTKLAELAAFIDGDTVVDENKLSGRLNIGETVNDVMGKYLLPLNNPYYLVAGNYTFFANDSSTLMNLAATAQSDNTLAKSIDYLNFSKNISVSSNLYLYINSSKLSELLNATASGLLLESLQGGSKEYQKFSPASVQFSFEENLFFTSSYINYRSDVQEKNNMLWKLNLDTVAATKSFYVLNHNTKESEIIIQDAINNLYLISRAGKIIWKKALNSRIISDIKQVDFYNNSKLQYLFNTEKELFIIDRESNYVTNFPLRLPDNATAGLLLATYSDVNVKRIFIPCGNRIYGYEVNGKPLQGWNPKENTGEIIHPLQHYVFDGKDYIVAINTAGQVFLLDRKGENRVEPVQLKEAIKAPLQANITDKLFELVTVSETGTVYKVDSKGLIKELKLNDEKSFIDFQYISIAGDNRPEYVFFEPGKLVAYNDSFNIAAEINFPANIDEKTFRIDSKNKSSFLLGIPSVGSNRTFILKADGTVFDDFIINGINQFEVDRYSKSERNIITTSDKSGILTCYKLM